jgi:hypothetical protein
MCPKEKLRSDMAQPKLVARWRCFEPKQQQGFTTRYQSAAQPQIEDLTGGIPRTDHARVLTEHDRVSTAGFRIFSAGICRFQAENYLNQLRRCPGAG